MKARTRELPAKLLSTASIAIPESIPLSVPYIGRKEQQAVLKCLRSGFVSSSGPVVTEFENIFAETVGAKYAVATASGTAALHVALKTLNIGQDDTVFVPDLTFVASLNPVLYCGATPVLLDIHEKTWCLDPEILELKCREMRQNGKKPSAVIPVHLYGSSCNMESIMAIARKYNLFVVEDATEALGTKQNNRQVGTFGNMGCFSFNGNKLLTTGSGGMIITDDEDLARRARYLVNQARDSSDNYIHSEAGFNYRMNSISAALGIAQTDRLVDLLRRKKEIAARYNSAFRNIDNIQLHPQGKNETSSFWLYSVVFSSHDARDSMARALQSDGIQSRGFFKPLHSQPYINDVLWIKDMEHAKPAGYGISDRISACGLNLPSSAGLTKSDQERVIRSFLGHLASSRLKYTHTSQKEIPLQKTA